MCFLITFLCYFVPLKITDLLLSPASFTSKIRIHKYAEVIHLDKVITYISKYLALLYVINFSKTYKINNKMLLIFETRKNYPMRVLTFLYISL